MKGKINKRQQRSIDRVIGYYERQVMMINPTVWKLDQEIKHGEYHISLVVRVTRTDCAQSSERAIFCNEGGHFLIGRGGKIIVCSSYRLGNKDKSDERHMAFMLNGVVMGSSYRPWTASRARRRAKEAAG